MSEQERQFTLVSPSGRRTECMDESAALTLLDTPVFADNGWWIESRTVTYGRWEEW